MAGMSSRAKHMASVKQASAAARDAVAQVPTKITTPMDAIHALDDIDTAIEALRKLRALAQSSQTYLVASDL